MAAGPHTFVTLSVFSPEPFEGNPLAIVAVRGSALTPQKKSLIAREFGYSETVFIHDSPGSGIPRRIEIFTEQGLEIPFAGHPVLGVGHYIFKYCEPLSGPVAGAPISSSNGPQDNNRQSTTTVMTKAGPVQLSYNAFRQVVACSIPHDIHVHDAQVAMSTVLNVQPQIQIIPAFEKCKDKSFPIVSIVKGMTFALVDLTSSPEVLGGLSAGNAPEAKLDKDWDTGLVGALYYRRGQRLTKDGEPTINAIQARMISHGIEDPGTGSACCTLACYLALNDKPDVSKKSEEKKEDKETVDEELAGKTRKVKLGGSTAPAKVERHVYAIKQGLEMKKPCTIAVEVDLKLEDDGTRRVVGVTLSGRACFFSRGELMSHH